MLASVMEKRLSEPCQSQFTGRLMRTLCIKHMIKALLILVSILMLGTANGSDFDKIYKGMYTWGAEVDIFQPCGSDNVFWVSASSWVKGPLIQYVKNASITPYQPIYIEFRGHMLDEVRDGFAEQYDGLVRVSEVMYKSTKARVGCL